MPHLVPLELSTRLIPAVALDWGDLADRLSPAEFVSIVLADPTWRRGGTPAERFTLLQEQMRTEILDATGKLREDLSRVDAGTTKDWIAVESFAKRIRGSINRSYYLAYQFGRETTNPAWPGFTQQDLTAVRTVIESEYEFLRGFTADLRAQLRRGDPLTGRLEWRADLYGKSLTKAFQMGLAAGDNPQDLIIITPGPNHDTHCQVCPTHWGTWTREQYDRFDPPMPPANRCEGMGNCHCGMTQRPAVLPTVADVARGVVQPPIGEPLTPKEEKSK